jgi:hypothetical protein
MLQNHADTIQNITDQLKKYEDMLAILVCGSILWLRIVDVRKNVKIAEKYFGNKLK